MLKSTEKYTILGRLKNGEATGMHLIPNSVLKAVKDTIPDRPIQCFYKSKDLSGRF